MPYISNFSASLPYGSTLSRTPYILTMLDYNVADLTKGQKGLLEGN